MIAASQCAEYGLRASFLGESRSAGTATQ